MEDWWKIWFEELKPWNGEAANEERFAWLLCFGMPLNGWSIPNLKLLGTLGVLSYKQMKPQFMKSLTKKGEF